MTPDRWRFGVDFEWDEAKRQANIRKHGIDFLDAVLVFGSGTIEWIDDREDYDEEGWLRWGRLARLSFV